MTNESRPRLAVLLGDPAGVGPEMAVKLLARARTISRQPTCC